MQTLNCPRGKLLAIGGAVDKGTGSDTENSEGFSLKFLEEGILRRLIEELEGKTGRIELITSASEIPEETGQHYIDAFLRLGHDNVGLIHIKNRSETSNTDYIERIRSAEGVLFTGGNQMRLTTIFGATEILKLLHDKYLNENFILAGTSAGAMAMSNTMIYGGNSHTALLKGEVKMSKGFGFIDNVIFDTHFIVRGRIGRICQAVAINPISIGIGLGEDTALLIKDGNRMEAIGSGLVIIVEGDSVIYTNIADIEDGEPISIENLTLHVLAQNHTYILSTRKMIH
jgi:cyanophycinase